ncbi:toll/interleukin-1 receptor domain-containing protein [Mesorhizobium escarrei]|uniref:TIR domain-containing protein n=1 Tax=Mesorhizobium escarrei TaxID=666018 RepID=A0ABM9E1Z6_9HYPH|nr:TIR domain-containing protein [Mesorhizobium escarrei]CAH2403100.1 conserved hypothetical protein [Mesorhizobium escarrei]
MQPSADSPQQETEFKYWAFISYSHADEAWGTWLHKALERYRVPRTLIGRSTPIGKVPKRILPVFRDRDELPGAANLSEKIAQALTRSRWLIVICSPRAAVSHYVNEEITAFKRLGRTDRILCFVVDGEPGATTRPQSGMLEAFPEAVRYELGPDGKITDRPAEPLAADARKDKDGKVNAKLKLLAGILGVAYDELKQRETRRRRWQFVQLAGLVVLLSAIIGGVWWNRQQLAQEESLKGEAQRLANASFAIPERNADDRLTTALRAVNLTRERYGYVVPEAEIALYRALTDVSPRGNFVETYESEQFGGWTWPLALNSDGSRMLVASAMGPTVVLNGSAEKIAVLQDAEAPYESDDVATFSADGTEAITGGADGAVRFWTPDGELKGRFQAHRATILTVDRSADGSLLLTVGCDQGEHQSCEKRSARLWRKQQGWEMVASFARGRSRVLAGALSPDGTWIATADEAGALRFWQPSGKLLAERLDAGSYWLARSNFSAKGDFLVTGGCHPYLEAGMFSPLSEGFGLCPRHPDGEIDPKVRLYDRRGKLMQTFPGWLAAVAPDDRVLTAKDMCDEQGACTGGRVYVWQKDGTPLSEMAVESSIIDVGLSPDGQFIKVDEEGQDGGRITILGKDGRVLNRLGGSLMELTSSRFNGDGSRVAAVSCPNPAQGACLARSVHVWDPNGPLLETEQLKRTMDPEFRLSQTDELSPALRFSPSGALLFAASNDGAQPVIWNIETGEMVALSSHADIVDHAEFNQTETHVLTSGRKNETNDQRLSLWDVRGQQLRILHEAYREDIYAPPFGVSKTLIAAGDERGMVRVWDWTGKLMAETQEHRTAICSMDVSATDDAIASVDLDGLVHIWNSELSATAEIDAGALNGGSYNREETTYKVRFADNGRKILVVGPGNMSLWDRQGLKLWDTDIDSLDFAEPQVGEDRFLVLQCTRRGGGVTVGSMRRCHDSVAKLWSLQGNELASLDAGTEGETMVTAATFNAKGNRIVTIDDDRAVRLWGGNGKLILRLLAPARAADFDPNGGRLATVDENGSVQLWEVWDDLDKMVVAAEQRLELYPREDTQPAVE